MAGRIRSSVQDLGTSCVELVKFAGSCQARPGDTFAMRDLADSARVVSERVDILSFNISWIFKVQTSY